MNKRFVIVLHLVMGIVIIVNVFQFIKPWFRSDERIRSDMLKLMPIGTSLDEAVGIMRSKEKWYIPTSRGLVSCSLYYEDYMPKEHSNDTIQRTNIRLSLKDYGYPFYYIFFAVNVTLGFDDNLKLRTVEVRQYLSI